MFKASLCSTKLFRRGNYRGYIAVVNYTECFKCKDLQTLYGGFVRSERDPTWLGLEGDTIGWEWGEADVQNPALYTCICT